MKAKNLADTDDFDKILAEMRDRSATKINGHTISEYSSVPWATVDEWADRLEVAVKQRVSNAYHRGCREYGKYFLAKIRYAITNCAKNEGLNHD